MGPRAHHSKSPLCKDGSRKTGAQYLWVTETGLEPSSPNSQARSLSGHYASLHEAMGTGAASAVGRLPLPSTAGSLPQGRVADRVRTKDSSCRINGCRGGFHAA